jgi:hypothetical protein
VHKQDAAGLVLVLVLVLLLLLASMGGLMYLLRGRLAAAG